MFNRRDFLASTGLTAATVALCRPSEAVSATPAALNPGSADKVQREYIARRRVRLAEHDPKIFLGYPGNKNLVSQGFLDWRDELRSVELNQRVQNNVGDPFRGRGVSASHLLEADLIERFGQRFGFSQDDIWGFVSNSGTDSNMHGVYIGRTLLQERTGVSPKIYYAKEAHYSIQIIRDLLGIEEVLVDALPDGRMDTEDLKDKLAQHADAPVLMVATIGTTFKGAIDDIDAIQLLLKGRESYVHLDAALFGGYLQASEHAEQIQREVDGQKRYDSIAVSCHKFFGYPGIAGLFVVGSKDFEEFRGYFEKVHDPAYISHVPGTITCSRDPVKPAEIHYYSTEESLARQSSDAKLVLENAGYLLDNLNRHFPQLNAQRASDLSNTIYFDNALSPELNHKWYLATVKATETQQKSMAHVVVMPHAEKALLDLFLEDVQDDFS